MGTLWAWVGVGAAGIGLDLVLIFVAIRYRRGRAFSILGGVILMLAVVILLACYVPLVIVPDVTANSAVFNRPALVDASATVFYLAPAAVYSTPSVPTDTLIAVAARTGTIRWQRTLSGTNSALAVSDDVAYVASISETGGTTTIVDAYRFSDGASLWQTTLAGGLPYPTTLAADGERVYVPLSVAGPQPQDAIVALRASDGAQLWNVGTGVGVYNRASLTVASGVAYLAAGGVQAYRASDGKPLWQNAQIYLRPDMPLVAAPGVAYLPGANGGFSAVRASDGATICMAGDDLTVHAIAHDGNTVYIAAARPSPSTDSQSRLVNPEVVYAYDATTCAPLWHYATTSNNSARGLIAGDNAVYVIADDGIHALRARDGTVLWHHAAVNLGSPGADWQFNAQPAILGSTLFVTSIVAFGGIQYSRDLHGQMQLYAIGPDGSDYWHVPVGHSQ